MSSADVQAVIEHYDGAAWTSVTTPTVPGSDVYYTPLQGVACLGNGECWAVGTDANQPSFAFFTGLVESESGGAWSALLPATMTASVQTLWSVTCVNASDCWAVGQFGGFDHYSGFGWYVLPVGTPTSPVPTLPNAPYVPDFYGVACGSPSECWAVGGPSASGGQIVIERGTPSDA